MNIYALLAGFATGLLLIGIYTILWSLVSLVKAKTDYIKAQAEYTRLTIKVTARNNNV